MIAVGGFVATEVFDRGSVNGTMPMVQSFRADREWGLVG
jgi:hypothetical protein